MPCQDGCLHCKPITGKCIPNRNCLSDEFLNRDLNMCEKCTINNCLSCEDADTCNICN